MGTLGRALVILHAALSLAVLAWAIGIYTHRIQWNSPQGAAKDDAVFKRQQDRAAEYNVAVDRAYTRWSGNLAQVQLLDNERYPRRAVYGTMLQLVQSGQLNGKDVPNPVKQPQTAANGFLDRVNPLNWPPYEVRPGVPADSITGYERKMARLVEDIRASQVRNEQALAERDILSLRRTAYADLAQAASVRQDRYSKSEVKFISTVDVAALQKKADDLAKQYRELDARIQEANWQVELLE